MASRPAQSKRPSIAAESIPKPPCKIHSLAVVSDKAQITGTHAVEIGQDSVLHPYARVRADCGRVTIGQNCTIAENAIVGVGEGDGEVIIGDGVVIESGAVVEATSIGTGTIIEVGARVGQGAILGKHCKISPLTSIEADEVLVDFTVVFGEAQRRLDQTTASNREVQEAKVKNQEMHVQLLKKLIVNASAKWG